MPTRTGTQARRDRLTEYFSSYNGGAFTRASGYATPDEMYFAGPVAVGGGRPLESHKCRCRSSILGDTRGSGST